MSDSSDYSDYSDNEIANDEMDVEEFKKSNDTTVVPSLYKLHFNGGTVGTVRLVEKNKAVVKVNAGTYRFSFKKMFVGQTSIGSTATIGAPSKFFSGTNFLFYIDDKVLDDGQTLYRYYYANKTLEQFYTAEEIVHYVGEVCNSNAPYPYAIGAEYIYLMVENAKLKTADVMSQPLIKPLRPCLQCDGDQFAPNEICREYYPAIDIMMRNPYVIYYRNKNIKSYDFYRAKLA